MHKYINTCIRILLGEYNADKNLRRGFPWLMGFYFPYNVIYF